MVRYNETYQPGGSYSGTDKLSLTDSWWRDHYDNIKNVLKLPYGAAHAEGYSTKALGICSHAEGYNCEAEGDYSHAEGSNTKAEGDYSHAEGEGTIAQYYAAFACGSYNAPGYANTDPSVGSTDRIIDSYYHGSETADYTDGIIFSIGIGSSDTTAGYGHRQNVFFVTKSGHVWVLSAPGSNTYRTTSGMNSADIYKRIA